MVVQDLYSLQVVAHYATQLRQTRYYSWLVVFINVFISAVPICLVTTGLKDIVEKVAGGLRGGVEWTDCWLEVSAIVVIAAHFTSNRHHLGSLLLNREGGNSE